MESKPSKYPPSFEIFVKIGFPHLTRDELLAMLYQMDGEKQKEKIDPSIRQFLEGYANYINTIFHTLQKTDLELQKVKNKYYLRVSLILSKDNPFSSNKSTRPSFPKTYKEYIKIWFPFLEEGNELLDEPSRITKETSYLKELLVTGYKDYYKKYSLYEQQIKQLVNELKQMEKTFQEKGNE